MILVVDNYDSFTYNLVHYLAELGATTHVVRNDDLTAEEAWALLGEPLGWAGWGGAAMIVTALVFSQSQPAPRVVIKAQ